MWINLRPRSPDAEILHLRQTAMTLTGELSSAKATIARLEAENTELREKLAQAQTDYRFAFDLYCNNPPQEGKHQ